MAFFSFWRISVISLYGILLLCNKTTSLLKNIELYRDSANNKYTIKLLLYSALSMLSGIKGVLLVPVEVDYITECILAVHSRIEEAYKTGTRAEAGILLAEKERVLAVSELRIHYSKKYLLYLVRSVVVLCLIYLIGCKVLLLITGVFIGVDLLIKRRVQQIEETKQRIHLAYTVEQDRLYREIAETRITRITRTERTKLENMHRVSVVEYSRMMVWMDLYRALYNILGLTVFYGYAGVAVTVLYRNRQDVTGFIVIYKKIEKLTKYFMKIL